MNSAIYDFGFDQHETQLLASTNLRKASAGAALVPNLKKQGREAKDVGFTKIPNRLFGSGTAKTLGPSATLLYIVLLDHANRHRRNTFSVSDATLAADTGLSTRTIFKGRNRLIEYKLITCERGAGQSYTYTQLAPSWGWVPVAKRPRTPLQPRANYARRAHGILESCNPDSS